MSETGSDAPFPPETTAERVKAALMRAVLRIGFRHTFRPDLPFESQRRRLLGLARGLPTPRGARFRPDQVAGVAGEWVEAGDVGANRGAIVYLHGGAHCVGAPATHRAITARLAAACGMRVFAADYRLAPEHPFPAAVDDAVTVVDRLSAADVGSGDVVVAGDSAGGNLALAATLRLRELSRPLPRALVLFSPFTDLSLEQLPPAPPGEIVLSRAWLVACTGAYLAGADPRQSLASPVLADLRRLPPTLIQVGTDELLLGDSRRLRDALGAAGVAVQYREFPGRWHVFQAAAGLLADADRALAAAADFIRAGAPTSAG